MKIPWDSHARMVISSRRIAYETQSVLVETQHISPSHTMQRHEVSCCQVKCSRIVSSTTVTIPVDPETANPWTLLPNRYPRPRPYWCHTFTRGNAPFWRTPGDQWASGGVVQGRQRRRGVARGGFRLGGHLICLHESQGHRLQSCHPMYFHGVAGG